MSKNFNNNYSNNNSYSKSLLNFTNISNQTQTTNINLAEYLAETSSNLVGVPQTTTGSLIPDPLQVNNATVRC